MSKLTVQHFQIMKDKEDNIKKDKFGNTQMMIKFVEEADAAYKAVKDPASITEGKVLYGTIQDGQYGPRFVADPYNEGGQTQAPSQPFSQANQPYGITGNVQTIEEPVRSEYVPTHQQAEASELLKLARESNKFLRSILAIVRDGGDTEPVEQADSDLPPVDSYDEPDFGG